MHIVTIMRLTLERGPEVSAVIYITVLSMILFLKVEVKLRNSKQIYMNIFHLNSLKMPHYSKVMYM